MGMKNSALMFHYASKGKKHGEYNGEYGDYGRMPHDKYREEYGERDRYRPRHERHEEEDDDEWYHHKSRGKKLTDTTAKAWVMSMENPEDKSKSGEHWTMEQTTQVLNQMKLPYDPVEFYAVMNMMYSDYYRVAKKYGQDRNTDFFVDMTKAWLDDDDTAAGKKKTEMYYAMIAK